MGNVLSRKGFELYDFADFSIGLDYNEWDPNKLELIWNGYKESSGLDYTFSLIYKLDDFTEDINSIFYVDYNGRDGWIQV